MIGSQAIPGQYAEAPAELLVSIEADVFPRRSPEKANLIDGAIGELSPFHETFGYYAHGVAETTAKLPAGWEQRLVAVRNENTGGATGWCLEVHDLAVSKLVAGREKDLDFVRGLFRHGLADPNRVEALLGSLPVSDEIRDLCRARVRRLAIENR